MRKLPALLEQMFTVFALMLYSGGPLNVILSGGFSQGDRQAAPPDFAVTRAFFILTYITFALLLLVRWKKVFYALSRDRTILPLVGFVCLSFFWSDFANKTLTECLALIGTTFFGIYFATRYTPKQQLQILGWTFGLVVAMSFVYAIAMPQFGIMGGVHAGAWRGIYTHKNVLGQMMTLSSMIFLLLMLRDRTYRFWMGLGLASSIVLMVLCTSKGALVNFLAMLAALVVCQICRLHYRLLVVLLSTIVVISGAISLWISINLETLVVDVLGKDLTFTGRTTLWLAVIDRIEQRPFLGYGYEGFWQGWESAAAFIWRVEGWPAPHAHNGFLDVALQIGIVGLAIFLIGFLVNAARSLSQIRSTTEPEFIWPILYSVFMILSNLGESALIKGSNIFWVLYVAIALSMLMPAEAEPEPSEFWEYYPTEDSPPVFRTQVRPE